MLLEGIFVPLTTPFHPDGRLFLSKLELNVARYSLTPAAGILVLGAEGEADALTDVETIAVLNSAISAAADEKVMCASVGRPSVAASLKLVEAAAAAGYDAVVIRPPWPHATDMRWELETYYQAIADATSIPLIIQSDLEDFIYPEQIARLAEHPQIVGAIFAEAPLPPAHLITPTTRGAHNALTRFIEATRFISREATVTTTFAAVTRRMARHTASASTANLGGTAILTAPALKTRIKKVGFQVLTGPTRTMLDSWGFGAVGAVPRLAACAPQACCEVWQAHKDGDPALAAEKQDRLRTAAELVEVGRRGIAALKYGCDLNAYFGGRPRLPLLPLTAAEREQVEHLMAGLKN